MAKHITKDEAEDMWQKVRKILVEHNVMTPKGEGTTNENDKFQKDMRKLILVNSQKK